MNDKWSLYLASSIYQHFQTNIQSDGDFPVTLFYEGLSKTDEQNDGENLVEVRFTGPFWTQVGSKTWRVNMIINCALQATINDQNNFKIWRLFGKVNVAFSLPILIKAYGDGEAVVGCLQLVTNKQDIFNNFLGQVDPNLKRVQGEVTAHYVIDLEDS